MSNDGLFVDSVRELAQPRDLSMFTPHRVEDDHPALRGVSSISFGRMLGQVAVTVDPYAKGVGLRIYGDEEMANALVVDVRDNHLALQGEIPFATSDSPGFSGTIPQGESVNVSRGSISFGSNGGISITSGRNITFRKGCVVNGHTISTSIYTVDGRQADMDRRILLALTIPPSMLMWAYKLYGDVGIGGPCNWLRLETHNSADFYVDRVEHLIATTRASGDIKAGTVTGYLTATTDSNGKIIVDQADCRVEATCRRSGNISIKGGTSTGGKFIVTSGATIKHKGTINGNASVTVTGSGSVKLHAVMGKCSPIVTGSGKAVIQEVTYEKDRARRRF